MKKPPEFPRYDMAYRRACELIVSEPVRLLPADPFSIIQRHRWGLVSYRELACRAGVSPKALLDAVPSPDGFTVFNGENYSIAYNGDVEVFGRIVFTLFHEIGHILLGHFAESGLGGLLPGGVCRTYELEANYFASNVMAPFAVMEQCGFDTVENLCVSCGMSHGAAEMRLAEFKSWTPGEFDERVRAAMLEYILVNRCRRSDFGSQSWSAAEERRVRAARSLQAGL